MEFGTNYDIAKWPSGAAISKGLNRICGTFIAGALGVAVHHIANLFGEKGEPVVLAIFVFLVGKKIIVRA